MSLFFFSGIFYLQSRNTAKNVETNTDVRIYFHDFLVYLCQHSPQQSAWYLAVSPAILQQLCHTRVSSSWKVTKGALIPSCAENLINLQPIKWQLIWTCCLAGYTEYCDERARRKNSSLHMLNSTNEFAKNTIFNAFCKKTPKQLIKIFKILKYIKVL